MKLSRKYYASELAQAMQADIIGSKEGGISHLLTDSRRLIYPAESLFFAIKTASNNGHNYVSELYDKGVRFFVVETDFQILPKTDATFFVVDNTGTALQRLATHHRKKFKKPVIAIAGSNGKTVVKEWLYHVLRNTYNTVRSPRSYNSQLGVPLSLWQISHAHNLAIIEAGVSKTGEMQKLQAMIQPDYGIFTNIGQAHSEGFDSNLQKAEEKSRLFITCKKVVYCADYKDVDLALKKHVPNSEALLGWSFEKNKAPIFVEKKENSIAIVLNEKTILKFEIPFSDSGWVENIIHIAVLANELGVSKNEISQQIKTLTPVTMRLEERAAINNNLLINDFYNSDPESIRLAIEHLMQQPEGRKKIMVISSLEGLPEASRRYEYQRLVALLNTQPIDEVVGIGKELFPYFKGIKFPFITFTNTQEFLHSGYFQNWHNAAILLKGARTFGFEEIAERLQSQIHQTWLEIDLGAMAHNLRYFKSLLKRKTKIMAMVKAFSYGAGTTEVARVLQYNHVDYLAVAYVDEGILLRKSGISLPIMVMNPDVSAFSRMIEYDLEPEIYSIEQLNNFIQVVSVEASGQYTIHIKIETGMNRLGFSENELLPLLEILNKNKHIRLASIFSHLAASESGAHDGFTQQQISNFEHISGEISDQLGYKPLRHIANTSGILRHPQAQFEMVRLGIGMYGIGNSLHQNNLKNVTKWLTRISQIKHLQSGDSVGYGRAFVAEKPMQSATLPVGYADGVFRSLGLGRGHVFVGGEIRPIIGNVCMDMIMVDVTGLRVDVGDIVEILGENHSVVQMALEAQTIPYEILTHISSRVPRVYITE